MPDLKELLEPLDQTEMPDRWDAIRRRPVTSMPEQKRSRVPVYAVSAAVAALALSVVAGLLPLGETAAERQPGSSDQPPAWLADAAYRAAYANGDMLPDKAEWGLLPRNAIPTPVGTGGAGSKEMEYLIVLHGSFTAYGASPPDGAPLPKGSVLSIAYDASTHDVTDFGLTDGDTGIEGLHSFNMPPSSAVFASTEDWTAAVPPGWSSDHVVHNLAGVGDAGSYIATTKSFLLAGQPSLPQASSERFPSDAIAIVVSPVQGPIPPQTGPLPQPPLSADDLAKGSAIGPTLDSMFFQGPNGVYVLTVRTGDDASLQDLAAANAVIGSIAWPSSASSSSSEPAASGLPSADSVVDGRFVRSVQLDNGFLRVDPPPAGAVPQLSKEMTDLLWASSAFQGKDAVTVGYGLITLGLAQQGIEKVESQPGWIAFATGGSYNCPIMTAAPSPADLPSGGYVAVSLVEGIANFAYTAASDVCGHVTDPAVGMARHVESVPWVQVGAVTNGRVVIRYTPPACAIDAAYDVSGNGDVYTLAVDMSVANDPLPCTFTQPVKTSVTLTQGSGGTTTELQHAPEGLVRQAQGVT